jgi:hypothetical protein
MPENIRNHYYKADVDNFIRMFEERAAFTGGPPASAAPPAQQLARIREAELRVFESQSDPSHVPDDIDRTFGSLHPVAIGAKMMQRLGFSKSENAVMLEILKKSYPRDPTGLYARQCMPIIVGLGHLHALEQKQTPVCLVEGDLTNMGGCNIKLGREKTDKLVYKICQMVNDELAGSGAQVHGVRAGGDEVRFVVYGLEKSKVEDLLLKKIHPAINLLSAQFGVHAIEHTKKGKLPGFGASFGVVDLAQEQNPDEIRQKLNTEINHHKQADGLLRFGLTDEASIERYLEEIYKPRLRNDMQRQFRRKEFAFNQAPAIFSASVEKERQELTALVQETRRHWAELTAEGGAYHDLAARQGVIGAGPRAFFSLQQMTPPQKDRAFEAITPPEPLKPEEKIPFYRQKVPDVDEDLDITRMRKTLSVLGFDDLAAAPMPFKWNTERTKYELAVRPKEQDPKRLRALRMGIDLMHFFDARDHASRCKSGVLLEEDIHAFTKRHDGLKILQLDLANLGGLNTINGELADAVLRATHKYIQADLLSHDKRRGAGKMGDHVVDNIYHVGGGKFKVLLPPTYSDREITALGAEIEQSVAKQIGALPIVDFAKKTYAYVPPRGKVSPPPGVSGDAVIETRAQDSERLLAALMKDIGREFPGAPDPGSITMSEIPHPKDPQDAKKRLGIRSRIEKARKGENAEMIVQRMALADEAPARGKLQL